MQYYYKKTKTYAAAVAAAVAAAAAAAVVVAAAATKLSAYIAGMQTNIFSPGASWALKIKLLGAQPKTKGPSVRQKIELISTKFICFTHTLIICIPQPYKLFGIS